MSRSPDSAREAAAAPAAAPRRVQPRYPEDNVVDGKAQPGGAGRAVLDGQQLEVSRADALINLDAADAAEEAAAGGGYEGVLPQGADAMFPDTDGYFRPVAGVNHPARVAHLVNAGRGRRQARVVDGGVVVGPVEVIDGRGGECDDHARGRYAIGSLLNQAAAEG